jgi:hypothetical protein
MKAQDEDRIRKQLDLIAQWRASGLPKAQWAAQHGVELKSLSGWLTYESRWKARLSGQPIAPRGNSAGFVAVRMAPSRVAEPNTTHQPSIRIEYACRDVILHWPLSHSAQLAHFLGFHAQP